MKFIIIEGPDGSGKGTMHSMLASLAGHPGDLFIDRFVGSLWVYSEMYGRRQGYIGDYLEHFDFLKSRYEVYQIILVAPPYDLLRRLSYRGDRDQTVDTLTRQNELFHEWKEHCDRAGVRTFWVNTSDVIGPRLAAETARDLIYK